MKVFWGNLSNDDANGEIIEYAVCYKASENATDIDCDMNKTVNNGYTREVLLGGLNEATTYNVAVRAATKEGFGMRGAANASKTLEASKRFYIIIKSKFLLYNQLIKFFDTLYIRVFQNMLYSKYADNFILVFSGFCMPLCSESGWGQPQLLIFILCWTKQMI